MKSRDRDEHISTEYARVSNPSFLSIIYDAILDPGLAPVTFISGNRLHYCNINLQIEVQLGQNCRSNYSTSSLIDLHNY